MPKYILKRVLTMIPILIIISLLVFFIIQLPPGDFLTSYVARMREGGEVIDEQMIARMRETYGLDQPFIVQYYKWISGIVFRGDFGYSFSFQKPVSEIFKQYVGITMFISLLTMIFTYVVAVPVGIYSATHQYSPGDYILTFIGFIGVAVPDFLIAILLMYGSFVFFGNSMLGIMSVQYINAAWSFAKVWDVLKHLIIPIVVIGLSSTSSIIRTMRGQLLDELDKPYYLTAKSKGLPYKKALYKYPVRASLGPIISTLGWSLTTIFTGSTITAIVLNLPTMGPVMHQALVSQDMYLAGSWLFLMAVLTMIGTLISDILLAWYDPRIKLDG